MVGALWASLVQQLIVIGGNSTQNFFSILFYLINNSHNMNWAPISHLFYFWVPFYQVIKNLGFSLWLWKLMPSKIYLLWAIISFIYRIYKVTLNYLFYPQAQKMTWSTICVEAWQDWECWGEACRHHDHSLVSLTAGRDSASRLIYVSVILILLVSWENRVSTCLNQKWYHILTEIWC